MTRQRVLLGHISQANGLRGDVLIKSYTANPEDIGSYGALTNEDLSQSFNIKVVRFTTKGVVAKIKGINDRNAAEGLRGTKLYIDRDQLPEPDDEDDFYHTDLIGLTAKTTDGKKVGPVVAVQNFGASDLLEIRPSDNKTTELIPFNKEFVPDIDIDGGSLTVVWPDNTTPEDEDEKAMREAYKDT
ncbi:MAG: ribosome maturation factor RimM [Hyphomicrobiaceae bacterium]